MVFYFALIGGSVGGLANTTCSYALFFVDIRYQSITISYLSFVFVLGGAIATLIYQYVLDHQDSIFLLIITISHLCAGTVVCLISFIFPYRKIINKNEGNINETMLLNWWELVKDCATDLISWDVSLVNGIAIGLGSALATNLGNYLVASDLTANEQTYAVLSFTLSQTLARFLVFLMFLAKFNPAQLYVGTGIIFAALSLVGYFRTDKIAAFVVSTLIGLSYGSSWSISFSSTMYSKHKETEYFSYLVAIYVGIPESIVSIVLNIIAGQLYDRNLNDGNLNCFGNQCFNHFFILSTVLGFLLIILSATLHVLYKRRENISSEKTPLLREDSST